MRFTVKQGDREMVFEAAGRRLTEQGEVLELAVAGEGGETRDLPCSARGDTVEVPLHAESPSWHVDLDTEQREALRAGTPVEVRVADRTLTVAASGSGRTRRPVARAKVSVGPAGGAGGGGGAVPGGVYPPMPGSVIAILVTPGQAVAAGEVLLILEAMKMQNEVRAPSAGTVASIAVEAGTKVDKAALLLVLDPS